MKPAALLALLLLSGCQRPEIVNQNQAAKNWQPAIYKDAATGCEYVQAGGIYPRIDSDGHTHRGCKTPLLEK